jgi:hypothetical protein
MAQVRRFLVPLLAALLLIGVAAVPASAAYPDEYGDEYDGNGDEDEEPGDDDVPGEEPPGPVEPLPEYPDEPEEPEFTIPVAPVIPEVVIRPTIGGKVAKVRTNGKAAIPRGAPNRVRAILAAANKIIGKPYKWGGGHRRLVDRGYDCSGAVSFALIKSGHLGSPLASGGFARWGGKGRGRWVTIYANRKHVYMEVAGLRLDTSRVADPGGRSGVRWRPVIGRRKGFRARHLTTR